MSLFKPYLATRIRILLLSFSLLFSACGTDTIVYPPSPAVNNNGNPGDPAASYMIVPLHDLEEALTVQVGEQVHLFLRVIDLVADGPAADYPVDIELTQMDPTPDQIQGDAELFAKTVLTNDSGLATLIVSAGDVPKVLYDLGFHGEGAASTSMDLWVSDIPRGDLRVSLNYDGPVPLKTIRIGLMPGSYNCSSFHAPSAPLAQSWVKTVVGVQNQASYSALSTIPSYTVFAIATTVIPDEGEFLAAGGCLNGVFVAPDTVNDVTLSVSVVPLKLSGTYRVEGQYNFTNVAVDFLNEQGLAGQILADVIIFFVDPGEVILKYVEEAAKLFLPALAVDLVFDLIGDPIGDALSSWLLGIPALQDFWTIGQDLTGVVSNLNLISLLHFSKVYSDYSLNGSQNFIGLNLYWKLGCDPQAPDYEECGKYTYTLEDFEQPEFPMDLATAQFTANILNWNQLQIDPHVLHINYGKLVLFVLNHVILPEIANGATSLSAAFQNILDCSSLGSGAIEDACNGALGFIGGFLDATIAGLKWDSNLSLQGSVTLLDTLGGDLIVDVLKNGVYSGSVVINGSITSPFDATFEGERIVPGP